MFNQASLVQYMNGEIENDLKWCDETQGTEIIKNYFNMHSYEVYEK
jgi:hypothetical protein